MSLLGIELGRDACRSLAISADGTVLATAQRRYSRDGKDNQSSPPETNALWKAVRETIQEVAARARGDPIHALSLASTSQALVPCSIEGDPLGPIIWPHRESGRATSSALANRFTAERLFEITGQVLPEGNTSLDGLASLERAALGRSQRDTRLLLLNGFVAHMMGGASSCDYSLASSTILLDTSRKQWSTDIAKAYGLDISALPALATAGSPLGTVSRAVSTDLGLSPRTLLVLGGHDLACKALGAGAIGDGRALCGIETASYLAPTFEAIPLRSLLLALGLGVSPHVVPQLSISAASDPTGGLILRWFRDIVGLSRRPDARGQGSDAYTQLLEEMPDAPSNLIVIPRFAVGGPKRAGPGGAILGLTDGTGRGEITKALLEGVCLSLAERRRDFMEAGVRIAACRAVGGGARSTRWLQLLADAIGVPVGRTRFVHTAALGAAILAGIGYGSYPGIAEAVQATVQVTARFEPAALAHDTYRERLGLYRELEGVLEPYLSRLSTPENGSDKS